MSLDTNPAALVFLVSGILAPLLYVATVIVGGAVRRGYSHTGNAISELVELHAPNRPALNVAFLGYNAFSIAFGIGITVVAANPTIVVAGWILAVTGLLGVAMSWFPMDPIGAPTTGPGIGHLVIAALMSAGRSPPSSASRSAQARSQAGVVSPPTRSSRPEPWRRPAS